MTFPDVPWATEVSKDYAQMANIPKKAWDPHHFWEFGQGLDTLQEAERIRDHLFCAIYGTYATVKAKYPEAANLQLTWVGHIAARRVATVYRRLHAEPKRRGGGSRLPRRGGYFHEELVLSALHPATV